MARAGGENFPVASRLLGARLRDSLLAIYGFARLVDQVGDEVAGDRLALLDWLDSEIDRIYAGGMPDHPALRRMAAVTRQSRHPRGAAPPPGRGQPPRPDRELLRDLRRPPLLLRPVR